MYPFSIIDPNTLMLIAIGVFLVTGLFMALAFRIREEPAYAWLAGGCFAFAIGWSLTLARHVVGVTVVTVPLANLFLLLLPVLLMCASLAFLRLRHISLALLTAVPILITLFFILRVTMEHAIIPGALTASLNGALYLGTAWIFNRYAYPHNLVARAIITANMLIGAAFIARTTVLLYGTLAPAAITQALIDQLLYATLLVNLIFIFAQALCFPLLDFMRTEAELARTNRRLAHLADRDALTGAYNRRAFTVRLEVEMQFHLANHLPLSVVLFDIDHFKAVNDTWGHGAGDAVILALVDIAEANCRKTDTIARFGGDEFTLLLPETDLASAVGVAEAIRAAVAATPPAVDPYHLPAAVTCSFGVASLTHRTDSQTSILAAADLALFQAKRAGRDRVHPPVGECLPGRSAHRRGDLNADAARPAA